jgi:hypothetical protein
LFAILGSSIELRADKLEVELSAADLKMGRSTRGGMDVRIRFMRIVVVVGAEDRASAGGCDTISSK